MLAFCVHANTWLSQKFCNISLKSGTIQQLWMLLLYLYREQTEINCEMSSSLNNFQVLLASMTEYVYNPVVRAVEYTNCISAERQAPPPQWVFGIWHSTSRWWGFCNAKALGNTEYLFIVIAPRSTLTQNGCIWLCPTEDSNRTVWHFN